MITGVAKLMDTLSGPKLDAAYQHFMALGNGGDTSQSHNLGTLKSHVKEDVEAIFDGQELSEEFKTKASTIFEAAVHARSIELQAQLEEEFAGAVSDGIAEAIEGLQAQVDKYLNHVAEQWLEENRLAVESGIKSDILESFMGGLKSVFTEHYIDIPEDKVDVVESLTAKVEELEAALNESENKYIEQQQQIQEMAKTAELETAFNEVSEGLTDTQVDKLKVVAESISFTTVDEFKEKLKTLAEGYVAKPATKSTTSVALTEEVQLDEQTVKATPRAQDPMIASMVERIKKSVK
jgi:BMFP domain-containing protein YqiC